MRNYLIMDPKELITCELPATGKVKSAVKLTNGKAAEVRRLYLEGGVRITESNGSSWGFFNPEERLSPNLRSTTFRDSVVFVSEHTKSFNPSCMTVSLYGTAVQTFWAIWRLE